MKRVLIVAGETSGDLHGAELMRELRILAPDIAFRGIGGARMISRGLEPVRHVRDMNFMGFAEVVRHFPFIAGTMYELEGVMDGWKPDLVVLIDYPGFNLRLAPRVKQRGIPLMYYISPQLWAWHRSRVKLIRRYVDRMVVIFGFEKEFYRGYGIDADFVGHPLIDVVKPARERETFRTFLGVGTDVPLIGLLPGSRPQEIERILPAMTGAVTEIRARLGTNVTAAVGCAGDIDDSRYALYLDGTGIATVRDETYDLMAHADLLLVTSGTATLEAGILATPMVIVYRTSPLTYQIGRRLVNVPHIGMINLVAGERVVPELWQDEVTPSGIADAAVPLLGDHRAHEAVVGRLRAVRDRLGPPGAAGRAAAVAIELLGGAAST